MYKNSFNDTANLFGDSIRSKGTGQAENLSNMDFDYFEAEIDKFRDFNFQNYMDDENEDEMATNIVEKVQMMDKDFKKVLEIC